MMYKKLNAVRVKKNILICGYILCDSIINLQKVKQIKVVRDRNKDNQ